MRAQGHKNAGGFRMVRLFGHCAQRLVEGHSRFGKRRKLPSGKRHLLGRQMRLRQRIAAIRRRFDGGRREAIGAKPIACGARRVGIEQPVAQAALRVHRFPAKRRHEPETRTYLKMGRAARVREGPQRDPR